MEAAPGTLTFIAPGSGFTRHGRTGSVFAMDVDQTALAVGMPARHPDAAFDWVRYPQVLGPPRREKRALGSAIADLVSALGSPCLPLHLAQCEGRLTSMLAGMLLPSSALIRTEWQRRGMSSKRFVAERRLAAAHLRLSKPETAGAVTGIATGSRYSHLGRFAIACREAFGELPSRTLRRVRRR